MSVKIDDKIGLDNINTKKTLICNYHKALVDPTSTENDINNAKGSIISFKNKLLKSIGNNKSVIKELSDITSIQGKTLEDLEKMEERLETTSGKYLSGTELKKNIYEENTTLSMHLIYYVLGIGFMGYYAIKLMKNK
jgi:hypothetical protein